MVCVWGGGGGKGGIKFSCFKSDLGILGFPFRYVICGR